MTDLTESWLRRTALVSIWLIATVGLTYYFAIDLRVPELWTLLRNGVHTQGIVTDKKPLQHQRISYEYSVGGHQYRWGGFAGDLGKRFEEVGVGEKVVVTYDPVDPVNSCLGEPAQTFYPNLRLLVFTSLIPSLVLLTLGLYRFFRSAPAG